MRKTQYMLTNKHKEGNFIVSIIDSSILLTFSSKKFPESFQVVIGAGTNVVEYEAN